MDATKSEEVRPSPKGLMLLVLRALAHLGGQADSFKVRDYIAMVMNADYPIANISVMLWRLERRKLVASEVPKLGAKSCRGRPRKLFSLTSGGKTALERGMRIFTASDFNQGIAENEETQTPQAC